MAQLYPIKCKPIYKQTPWGGSQIASVFNRTDVPSRCGESWEISALQDSVSVIENGFLAGNTLQEVIEVYMDEIVGQHVYEKFGIEFPLLCKFIDSHDYLSVQVHPDNELAKERHTSYGKTEMWYVIKAEEDAQLILGFDRDMSRDEFIALVQDSKQLVNSLSYHAVQQGEVFYVPAGLVHAIGQGVLLAEIQQTSDVTYRMYDWDRKDAEGNERELHLDMAVDAIDYSLAKQTPIVYESYTLGEQKLVESDFFVISLLHIHAEFSKDYYPLDSCVIYMCVEGTGTIRYGEGETETISQGETVLLPAALREITIRAEHPLKILEVYVP
ncbi:MAG: type I phosphomannose isomerase catalytic subunit [Bacteroidales bacterium]